jgi:uncharacterized protein YndB with AHSA1/START domain
MMNVQSKKRDLVVTHILGAPVEQVWQAWSDPDLVMRWWGPHGFVAPLAKMDFRVGGTSLVCMNSPQFGFGDQYSTWHYEEIVPMQRIVFIQNLTDKDGNKVDPAQMGLPPDFPQDMRSTVTFKPMDDQTTEITVVEHGWQEGQMMEMSEMGMKQCLEKMAAIFVRE